MLRKKIFNTIDVILFIDTQNVCLHCRTDDKQVSVLHYRWIFPAELPFSITFHVWYRFCYVIYVLEFIYIRWYTFELCMSYRSWRTKPAPRLALRTVFLMSRVYVCGNIFIISLQKNIVTRNNIEWDLRISWFAVLPHLHRALRSKDKAELDWNFQGTVTVNMVSYGIKTCIKCNLL